MEKAYRLRIEPNKEQEILIYKTFGCHRYIYNYFLAKRKELEQKAIKLTYNQCSTDLTLLKKELLWLKEPDKFALQNALKDLNQAFENYYREQRKGNKEYGYPSFHSKRESYKSYRTNFTNNNIKIGEKQIKLPKLGWIKFKKSNKIDILGKISKCNCFQNSKW